MKNILIPILKGIKDASGLSSIAKAIKDFRDIKKPSNNIVYLGTFFLTLLLLISFLMGKIDIDTFKTIYKILT